jgi:hypothetical protein
MPLWWESGGFLGLQRTVFRDRGGVGARFLERSEHYLVIDFGFGEQNGVLMKLLLTFFGGFAAQLVCLFVLLRFEPNFGLSPFGSEP